MIADVIESIEIASGEHRFRRQTGAHFLDENTIANDLAASISCGVTASLVSSEPRRPSTGSPCLGRRRATLATRGFSVLVSATSNVIASTNPCWPAGL